MYFLAPYSSAVGISGYGHELNLADQDLTGLDISNTRIVAKLSRATQNSAILENANLRRSTLTDTSLIDAHLCNAQLLSTDLDNANFQRADLRGADLSSATIDGTNFQGAIYNADTQFPEGFDLAAAGAVFDEASADCPPLE